jgi:hypothetical protein
MGIHVRSSSVGRLSKSIPDSSPLKRHAAGKAAAVTRTWVDVGTALSSGPYRNRAKWKFPLRRIHRCRVEKFSDLTLGQG